MPVFQAHIPANRYSKEQKAALADALNLSLVEALGIPKEDRFIMITEHKEGELYLHPSFMGMNRNPEAAMFVTVHIGAHRSLEDKKLLLAR